MNTYVSVTRTFRSFVHPLREVNTWIGDKWAMLRVRPHSEVVKTETFKFSSGTYAAQCEKYISRGFVGDNGLYSLTRVREENGCEYVQSWSVTITRYAKVGVNDVRPYVEGDICPNCNGCGYWIKPSAPGYMNTDARNGLECWACAGSGKLNPAWYHKGYPLGIAWHLLVELPEGHVAEFPPKSILRTNKYYTALDVKPGLV